MLRTVAGTAAYVRVLAVEHIPCFRVVKAFWRWIPVQQRKVLPVVIGVAFDAGRPRWSRARKSSVKPPVPLQLVRNLAMAFDTAKGGRLGRNLMTFDTVGGSVQVLVRPGKRSRGNLRIGYPGKEDRETPCTH